MNSKKIPTILGIIIIVIIAVTAGMFTWKIEESNFSEPEQQMQNNQVEYKQQKEKTSQPEEVGKDNTSISETQEVSFCGKAYNFDKLTINETDVVKTIARISEKENWICKNMELGKFQESGINISQKKDESGKDLIVFFHKGDKTEQNDPFNQSPYIFKFDFSDNKVSYQDQFTGNFNTIGNIK